MNLQITFKNIMKFINTNKEVLWLILLIYYASINLTLQIIDSSCTFYVFIITTIIIIYPTINVIYSTLKET